MTAVLGTAPVLWPFTISDDNIAAQLSDVMGKPVIMHYKEYGYIPNSCFGNTTYFVDKVGGQE